MEIAYDSHADSGPFPIGSIINQETVKICPFGLEEYFFTVHNKWPADRVFNWASDFPYVAIHPKCLELTQRVCNYRRLHGLEGARSLGQFYEIYRDRIEKHGWTFGAQLDCFLRVAEPHHYYILPSLPPRDIADQWHQWPTGRPDLQVYEASPFPIPDISSQILMFLQPLSNTLSSLSSTNMQAKIPHIPEELLQMIFAQLHPFVNPPVECTRNLPPRIWRRLIFYDGLFPWLWDLDPTALQSTRPGGDFPSYEADDFWDWEMLARQLAQTEIFEDGNLMDQLPWGLLNRRRIWRLIDEAERCAYYL